MKKVFPILGLAILLSGALITLAITSEAAKDPVCGMEVNPTTAAASLETPHGTIYFCSQHCKDKYVADPSAYTTAAAPAEAPQAVKSGCEGCSAHAAEKAQAPAAEPATTAQAKTAACLGDCGQTRVTAVNDFHTAMQPLEDAAAQGELAPVKAAAVVLAEKKAAVMQAACPEGGCSHTFEQARAEFGKKVDALLAAIQAGSDEALSAAFQDMHQAYRALDLAAR